MPLIYLDYNVIIHIKEGGVEYEDIRTIFLTPQVVHLAMTPYSPAHIEEICTSFLYGNADDALIEDKINFISIISSNLELFPERGGPVRLCIEDPHNCYARVISKKNDELYERENNKLREYESISQVNGFDINSNINSNLKDIVYNKEICSIFKEFVIKYGFANNTFTYYKYLKSIDNPKSPLFPDNLPCIYWNFKINPITEDHEIMQIWFEIMFDFLEFIKFSPEGSKKSRSRLHDISHAIYGGYTDLFITGDDGLHRKVQMIYRIFSIETEVLHEKEVSKFNIGSIKEKSRSTKFGNCLDNP